MLLLSLCTVCKMLELFIAHMQAQQEVLQPNTGNGYLRYKYANAGNGLLNSNYAMNTVNGITSGVTSCFCACTSSDLKSTIQIKNVRSANARRVAVLCTSIYYV